MTCQTYLKLIGYKRWADRGLYGVVEAHIERLPREDASILLRILDHIHVVDAIFRHHLLGLPSPFTAARSNPVPEFGQLMSGARDLDDWYVDHVSGLGSEELEQPIEFVLTSGKPARMQRSEMLLHVCLHGTYHRGNAGILLQKAGVAPNDDRMTDFLGL